MAKPKVPNTRVHPLAHDALVALQTALERDHGRKERREDIVSALLHGVTAPQAAGMLPVFHRDAAAYDSAANAPTDQE
jgi:hypothetical protein